MVRVSSSLCGLDLSLHHLVVHNELIRYHIKRKLQIDIVYEPFEK